MVVLETTRDRRMALPTTALRALGVQRYRDRSGRVTAPFQRAVIGSKARGTQESLLFSRNAALGRYAEKSQPVCAAYSESNNRACGMR